MHQPQPSSFTALAQRPSEPFSSPLQHRPSLPLRSPSGSLAPSFPSNSTTNNRRWSRGTQQRAQSLQLRLPQPHRPRLRLRVRVRLFPRRPSQLSQPTLGTAQQLLQQLRTRPRTRPLPLPPPRLPLPTSRNNSHAKRNNSRRHNPSSHRARARARARRRSRLFSSGQGSWRATDSTTNRSACR